MLRVLGDNARIAHTVKFDTPCAHQHGNRLVQFAFFERAARAEQGGGGVAQHFFHHVAHRVVRIQLFMDECEAGMTDAGGQGQFEFGQAFEFHAAAKPNHRGLGNVGALGNFRHRGVDKPFGFAQYAFGHFAFGI